MTTLGDAVRRTVEVLNDERVPYMVIGGIAVAVWGDPRATRDIDITVDVATRKPEEFLEVARRIGDPMADDPEDVARRGRLVPVRTPEGVTVDLVLATLSIELEAIGRAAKVDIEGTAVRVCSASDLILHKVISERPRDHEDVIGVLRRQGEAIDSSKLDEDIAALASALEDPAVYRRWQAARRAAGPA